MSYQYPPMHPHGPDMGMPHSGYIPNYSVPSQQASLGMSNMQEPLASSKDSEGSVRTPFPTPNDRPPQQPTPEAQLLGEKRRNKLGYHRISLACGNCRRRKIRCIPSPFDNQGRCTNCIRLKKECSFYPVDQQPPTDPRGESSSRASTAPKGTSASSSPATSNGVPAEPSANQPFRTLTMQQVPSMALPTMKAVTAETVPPEANMPSNVPGNRPYGFAGQSAPNWIPTDAGHSPNSKPGDMNAIWRPYPPESPASSQFSSYSHGPPSSTTWTSAGSESESRDDLAWGNYPPPVRSMSYGGEPLTGHHPAHYPPIPHGRQFDRRSSTLSDAYTPSLAVAVPNMDVGHTSSIEQLVPLSAGEIPPPNFEGWHHQHQPHQQQSQLPYSKPGEPFGDWELGGGGGGQQPHTNEPGPHNEPDPAGYYARR